MTDSPTAAEEVQGRINDLSDEQWYDLVGSEDEYPSSDEEGIVIENPIPRQVPRHLQDIFGEKSIIYQGEIPLEYLMSKIDYLYPTEVIPMYGSSHEGAEQALSSLDLAGSSTRKEFLEILEQSGLVFAYDSQITGIWSIKDRDSADSSSAPLPEAI